MAISHDSDDKIFFFNKKADPLNPIRCSFEKIRSQKMIIAKFEVKKDFYSDLPKINIGGNQITSEVFSPRIS